MDNEKNSIGLAVSGSVGFPVAGHTPGINGGWTSGDGYAIWNVLLEMFALNVAAVSAFPMRFRKKASKMGSIRVDPLIDGLMADALTLNVVPQTSRNLLRRPAQLEFGFDVSQDDRITQTLVPGSQAFACSSAKLSGVWAVVTFTNRASVTAQLT